MHNSKGHEKAITPANVDGAPLESTRHPSFGEAFLFWLRLGFISFGGPTGQIAIMHAELVEKKKWISEARFLHALNYCMLLPGLKLNRALLQHRRNGHFWRC